MKHIIRLIISFCFCPALLVFPQNFFGQHAEDNTIKIVPLAKGEIRGVISDFKGFEWSEIVISVKLKSSDNSLKKEYSTATTPNSKGEFSAKNLPPGVYVIVVFTSSEGIPYINENVKVMSNETTTLDIRLNYGEKCENTDGKTFEITDTDKKEIANQVLEEAILKRNNLEYNQKGEYFLSTENIKPDWIKPLPKIKLKLMTPAEIQAKADSKGDFLYLSFAGFAPKGKCVLVMLVNGWAKGKSSDNYYLSGSGLIFLYLKESGKWIGKYNGGWIS
jgi:hypothetical protein